RTSRDPTMMNPEEIKCENLEPIEMSSTYQISSGTPAVVKSEEIELEIPEPKESLSSPQSSS
ncbi:Uncharacterized protein DAT39_022318, partial [Clarias magur]